MVGTIVPIGDRERLAGLRRLSLGLHCAGCVTGGAILGAGLGLLGDNFDMQSVVQRSSQPMLVGLGGLCLGCAGRELRLWRLPLPSSPWQVPAWWLLRAPARAVAFAYGVVLGAGVFTRIPSSTFYPLVIMVAVLGDPFLGAAAFSLFGFARSVPVLAFGQARDGREFARWTDEVATWQPIARLLNGLLLACLAGWFATAGLLAVVR